MGFGEKVECEVILLFFVEMVLSFVVGIVFVILVIGIVVGFIVGLGIILVFGYV